MKREEADERAMVPVGVYMHDVHQVKQYMLCFYSTLTSGIVSVSTEA